MKTSRRFKKQRQFFDVAGHHSSKKQRFSWLLKNHSHIDLRPSFLKRFPRSAVAMVAVLVVSVFFGRQVLLRAETASYYPKTCLGTWHNGDKAQGQPEGMASGKSINSENAAEYPGSLEQIFCGGFLEGEKKNLGKITHIGVTLAWRIGEEEQVDSNTPGVFVPEPQSLEGEASTSTVGEEKKDTPSTSSRDVLIEKEPELRSVDKKTPTTSTSLDENKSEATTTSQTTPEPAQTPQDTEILESSVDSTPSNPTNTPPPTSEVPTEVPVIEQSVPPSSEQDNSPVVDPVTLFFRHFIPSARAAGASSSEVSEAISEVNKSSTISTDTKKEDSIKKEVVISTPEQVLSEEQIEKEIEKIGTETPPTLEATTTIQTLLVSPDENFLVVSYSVNSTDWIEVGKVNKNNWRHLTLSLPISSWADLERLQIRIEGVPTILNPIPPVFLDGMFMEVHYEKNLIPGVDSDVDSGSLWVDGREPSATELQTMKAKIENDFSKDTRVSNQYRYEEWIAFNLLEDGQYDIYLKNEANGEVERVTETPYNESYPVIRNGQVAWTFARGSSRPEERGEIMLYDIASKTLLQITNDGFVDDSPQFDEEGRLTWRKLDAIGTVHQFVYNPTERTALQIDDRPFTTALPPEEPDDD